MIHTVQCVPSATVDKAAATTIVVDEIGNQVDITASASTSSGHLLMPMGKGKGRRTGVAAAATTAVVTFPFIERKMRLGLVESVLQLGDASPAITCFRFLMSRMVMLLECCLWRWDLWLFLLMMVLIVATIPVPEIFLPDVVLVEVDLVFFVVVVLVFVRGNVPILGVATVLGTDRSRGRFVIEFGGPGLLVRRVRNQLRRM